MTTYAEKYAEQHVRGVMLYGKTSDHKLYTDSDMTVEATQEEVTNLFVKNMLVILEGDVYLKAVVMDDNNVYTIDIGESAVTATTWTCKASA